MEERDQVTKKKDRGRKERRKRHERDRKERSKKEQKETQRQVISKRFSGSSKR